MTNNALTSAMLATTNGITATGTSGYVEFYIQTQTLDGTDGWTFQLDAGSGYVTRLSELTGSSHAWQKYHYDLASGELVDGLKMRFQFTGGGTGDLDDRIDLDQITVTTVSGGGSTSTVTMYDDGLHGDGAAGDHVYGGQIPAQAAGHDGQLLRHRDGQFGLHHGRPGHGPDRQVLLHGRRRQQCTHRGDSGQRHAESGHRDDHGALGAGCGRGYGRSEPDLHLDGDYGAQRRHGPDLQRQRHQRGEEHHGHVQQGGQLHVPGRRSPIRAACPPPARSP